MLPTKLTTAAVTLAAVFLCYSISDFTHAQENAQLQIPASLVECYNTSYFMNRDNRLPSNIETLITLIEKVENWPDYNMDIRTLSIALIQRFRQDGIQRAPGLTNSPGIIPYSPTGFQFPKFRILISRLIPGNAYNFPNISLSREERCSLHFMLSSSFDTRSRGDENQVCNKLSQYRSQRLPRSASNAQHNNFLGDAELLDTKNTKTQNRAGALYMGRSHPNVNAEALDYDYNWPSNGDNSVSQCPVENGVIRTPWGTVAAGNLIAGIAAGLQPQSVQLRTLLALSRRPGMRNLAQTTLVNVDNRWAATLAGDLAEVTLLQVPVSSTSSSSASASVGASGAWNSTVMPKWYFLSQRQNLEMTDAEIRGGLDGLIIAMNIATWRTQVPTLKLSQLLRMYYSLDGVLGTDYMACNRKVNFATIAPLATMVAQSTAFSQVLDREMQLRYTLNATVIAQFSTLASNALNSYVPQYLNDVSCSVSSALPTDVSQNITAMTNIYVFLDTTWQYSTVVDYVNYVLQNLNINPYASNVTLLAAYDGSIIVNTTNYISSVYEQWNVTTHATFIPGFNLPTILQKIQNLTQTLLNIEQTNSSVGGQSLIALLIPSTSATVGDSESSFSTSQLQYIYEQIPDLHFIFYGGGTINRFQSFVRNPSLDLYALSTGVTAATSSMPVVLRIKNIPRRIINPRCGSSWYTNSWGTDQMYQYEEPGVINFYRMVPNYFYGSGSGRYVNIQSQNSMQFTVCTSRSVVLPMMTSANSSQNCIQISGSSFAYDLSNACSGYYTIHQCPPLYLSVQATQSSSGTTSTVSCTDNACQTPDQLRFIVSVVNMGCYSDAASVVASVFAILLALCFQQILK